MDNRAQPSSSHKRQKLCASGLNIFREQDGSPDLLSLYSGDLGERILSYASGHDLCKLDVISRKFQEVAATEWERVTYERFGMRNGKEGWKQGTAFLREAVFILLDTADHPEMNGMGWGNITSHNSLIGVSTNYADHSNGIAEVILYDANDLTHIGTKRLHGGAVVIAGPHGEETFVTNIDATINISRRKNNNDIRLLHNFRVYGTAEVQKIGSQRHVIVLADNVLHLYQIPTGTDEDLIFCQSVSLGSQDDADWYFSCFAWGLQDESEFVVYQAVVSDISNGDYTEEAFTIWRIDKDNNRLIQTQSIYNIQISGLDEVALAEDYIIGTNYDRTIHVWDRRTGEKMAYSTGDALYDGDGDEFSEEDFGFMGRLDLSCHGNLLVATSRYECAICIWDIKTGLLEKTK